MITEFGENTFAGAMIYGITAGPDGNLWFTELSANKVGKITPAGDITEFGAGISANAGPYEITAGPDGNLWFAENFAGGRQAGGIARITPLGQRH